MMGIFRHRNAGETKTEQIAVQTPKAEASTGEKTSVFVALPIHQRIANIREAVGILSSEGFFEEAKPLERGIVEQSLAYAAAMERTAASSPK